jgi:predicted Zn-dependent protease with MMP-like domain
MEDRHARHRRSVPDRHRRPDDGFRLPTSAAFDRVVADAVAGLPAGLRRYLDGVRVATADVPPSVGHGDEVLLSRYERTSTRTGWRRSRPDERVVFFRRPLEARAHDRHDLAELIRHALVDELAERFDLDDDRLDELGWP